MRKRPDQSLVTWLGFISQQESDVVSSRLRRCLRVVYCLAPNVLHSRQPLHTRLEERHCNSDRDAALLKMNRVQREDELPESRKSLGRRALQTNCVVCAGRCTQESPRDWDSSSSALAEFDFLVTTAVPDLRAHTSTNQTFPPPHMLRFLRAEQAKPDLQEDSDTQRATCVGRAKKTKIGTCKLASRARLPSHGEGRGARPEGCGASCPETL